MLLLLLLTTITTAIDTTATMCDTDCWDYGVIDEFFEDARNNTVEYDEKNPPSFIAHHAFVWLHTHKVIKDYHIYQAWFAVRQLLLTGYRPATRYDFLEQMDYCPEVFMKCFSKPCKLSEYSKVVKQLDKLVDLANEFIDELATIDDFHIDRNMIFEPEMLLYFFNPDDYDDYDDDDEDDYYDMFDSDCAAALRPFRYRNKDVEKVYNYLDRNDKETMPDSDCPEDETFNTLNVSSDDIEMITETIDLLKDMVDSYDNGQIYMGRRDMRVLEEYLADARSIVQKYPL